MTEPDQTITEPAPVDITREKKGRTFLGLYIPNELKDKIAIASKKDRRSMSNFSEDILENYFATK